VRFLNSAEIEGDWAFLQLTGVRAALVEARPSIAKRVVVHGRPALTVDLPSGFCVVLGRFRTLSMHCWMIVARQGGEYIESAWHVSTPEEHLRDAVLAIYDACVTGAALPTPWCWSEPSRSTVVQVADSLIESGIQVQTVVSANRVKREPDEEELRATVIDPAFGDALRVKMPWGIGTLARKAQLGWVFDVQTTDSTRRVDLAEALTGVASVSPGLITDDAELLVQGVTRIATGAEPLRVNGSISPLDSHPRRLEATSSWWLRELGYSGFEADASADGAVTRTCHVVTSHRRFGLSALKKAYADAALERKSLVVFTEGGYTRDARRWADKARVALFAVGQELAHIRPASAFAAEHIPDVL
jgi:hypothetical protein